MASSIHHVSPTDIPKNFTALTPSYQLRAALAILSIILFFVLYFSLVVFLGYVAYLSVAYDMGSINKFTILMKLGAMAGAVMLFIFTLKFIFKIKNHKPKNRIKLNMREQTELKKFVYDICKKTGAPKPKSVYIDPDVNAYVSYTNMWLSLFLPVRKDLTLGCGLISCLNVSEFKAVTAHEFGHFAQSSMKIGSYIISANTIIHDMIFTRDAWDNTLEQWRASDIRLSAAAWLITPVIWLIRQTLNLFYQFLNLMHSSLSREMEFNADKVAVSVTGSDAIVSALWKLDNGSAAWSTTINHAYMASQKKIFVKNLYAHNNLELERIADTQNETLQNLPDDHRGGKRFFSTSENSKVGMYTSHPPNDHRENNAKTPYIECEANDVSPWLLFSETEKLQEKMTLLIYKQYLDKTPKEFASPGEFEAFIEAETQGKELLTEYYNTFENRFLNIPDEQELIQKVAANEAPIDEVVSSLKTELNTLMQPVREIETLMLKAQQIAQGTTKEESFSFTGKTYNKKNLEDGYNALSNEREKLFNEQFTKWDANFCAFHYALAKKLNKESELTKMYNQHTALSKLFRIFAGAKNSIFHQLEILQTREDVTEGEVSAFGSHIKRTIVDLNKEIYALDDLAFVPMPNIDDIAELKEAIVDGGSFKKESGKIFENGGFDRFLNSLTMAISHLQRIDQKSIASILLFHKELHKQLK